MLSLGDVLNNRYRVDRMLEIGALEGQYGGWDLVTDESVVIKELMPQPELDPEELVKLQANFDRDAALLAALDHPHIVRIIDHFCSSPPETAADLVPSLKPEVNAYLVLQSVSGQSLAEVIAREGNIHESRVARWAEEILSALSYAHERGVVHRDIRPANIVITPDDHAMLTSFEIVALWNPLDPRMWTAKRVMGNPEYAPPECWGMKMTHVDARSDLYSLGASLYHALTGEQPLTAGERTSNPYRFLQVKALSPKVSAPVQEAVLRAMELPQDKRFQNAAEMARAFKTESVFSSTSAPPPAAIWPNASTHPWDRKQQPKLGFAKLIVSVVVLAGAAAIGMWLNRTLTLPPLALFGGRPPTATPPPAGSTPVSRFPGAAELASGTGTPEAVTPTPGTPAAEGTDPVSAARPMATRSPETSGPAPPPGWQPVLDDAFDGDTRHWLQTDYEDDWGTTSRQVVDGTYRWEIEAAQAVGRWCTPELGNGTAIGDFYAGVDAQRVEGPASAAYGLILRHIEGSYYLFNVRDDGYYQFSLWYGYEWLPIIDWTETTAVRSGEVNHLAVIAEDGQFAFYINDTLVDEAENDQLPEGEAGLSISTAATEGQAIFVFDNFELWQP